MSSCGSPFWGSTPQGDIFYFSFVQDFLLNLIKTVGIQIFSLFGIFFVLGFILLQLQKWTNNQYSRSIGWKGILFTAWFGTPIHEIGHVFFAKLFRHKVTYVALFEPNPNTGGLGHVNHEFRPYSLYQRVGNFFIGAAPMIFGSAVLVSMLYVFVPNAKEIFSSIFHDQYTLPIILTSVIKFLTGLFSLANLHTTIFYAFLYLSFCVAAHIAPSGQDLKNMWEGFVWMVILLILVNAIPVLLGIDLNNYIHKTYFVMTIFIAIFLYAIFISLLHFLIVSVLAKIFFGR